jgi:hypothetical protein
MSNYHKHKTLLEKIILYNYLYNNTLFSIFYFMKDEPEN